jgi:hypothetical protein
MLFSIHGTVMANIQSAVISVKEVRKTNEKKKKSTEWINGNNEESYILH